MSGKEKRNVLSFVAQRRRAIQEGRAYEDPALTASWQDMCTYNGMFARNTDYLLKKRKMTVKDLQMWLDLVEYRTLVPRDNDPYIGPTLQTLCVIARHLGSTVHEMISVDMAAHDQGQG